jgi:hypothetical protein
MGLRRPDRPIPFRLSAAVRLTKARRAQFRARANKRLRRLELKVTLQALAERRTDAA